MKNLFEPDAYMASHIGTQIPVPGLDYELSKYVIVDGNNYYNCFTNEGIEVEDLEKDKNELIRRWFYVPKIIDLPSIVYSVRQNILLAANRPGGQLKNVYIIFTTTGCNASCEYCFEKGFPVSTMSEKTAVDVGNYILRTYNKRRELKLKWFGGEPLVNKKAINIITDILNRNNVKYWSEILTNGDLLPNCTDEELKNWHATQIQLTVDDIGSEYERIKGLPSGSYEKLKQTIERLNNLKIRMPLRLHYDPEKGLDNCYRVIEDLKKYPHCRFYIRNLYGLETENVYKEVLKMEDYIMSFSTRQFNVYNASPAGNHCMADSYHIACITPTGELTPCEHYAFGDPIYGSIYTREKNRDILDKWSVQFKYSDPTCIDCVMYPMCKKLTMCPAEGKCSEGYQYYQIETIKRALRKKVEEINGRDSNTNN